MTLQFPLIPTRPITLTLAGRSFRLVPYGQGGMIYDPINKCVLRSTGSRQEFGKWIANAVRAAAGMAALEESQSTPCTEHDSTIYPLRFE